MKKKKSYLVYTIFFLSIILLIIVGCKTTGKAYSSELCGNFICNSDLGETAENCPHDCLGVTTCNNNGVCGADETENSCPNYCIATEKILAEMPSLPKEIISEEMGREVIIPEHISKQEEVFDGGEQFVGQAKSLEEPKVYGYIIEFKEEPLVIKEKELKKQPKEGRLAAMSVESQLQVSISEIQTTHEKAKSDIEGIINRKSEKVGIRAVSVSSSDILDIKEFKTVFNGIALDVSEDVASEISKLPYVKDVYEDKEMHIVLMDSVPLINADDVWGLEDNNQNSITGKNMRIAIIDTGIDYTHPDLGGCFGYGCKVIDGWDFVNNDNNPMDDHGHGTHCAGTAAGSGSGGLKGVAPDAELIAYKVCNNAGSCQMSQVIQAIERAADPNQDGNTSDHYDIISMSLGVAGNPDDSVSKTTDNAVKAGIIAVAAAGNSGPGALTIGSPGNSRKAITVGASNNDFGRTSVLYANEEFINSTSFLRSGFSNDLIAELKNVIGYGTSADFSQSGDFTGKIALISRGTLTFQEKVNNAKNAGAVGAIIYNNAAGNFLGVLTDPSTIPAVSVSQENGVYLLNLLSTGNVFVNITVTKNMTYPNYIADFSSRGPTSINTIKPDIVAPGVYICAPEWGTYTSAQRCLDSKHIAISGTSMATPHVAGVAALLKQAHPDWTPEEIKMALRDTAVDLGLSYTEQGWGRVDALAAINLSSAPCIAELNSYGWSSVVFDSMNISVSATCKNNFKNWTLEYGRGYNPSSWNFISSSVNSSKDILVIWNLTFLPVGKYSLRLTVNNYNLNSSRDILFFNVGANISIPITNCMELQAMSDNLLGNYHLANDINCSDTRNWNNGFGFNPVGKYNSPFYGTFDGQGYKIKDLYINRASMSQVGLFGVIGSTSHIKNVGLLNVNVTAFGIVGALVGDTQIAEISNSYSIGSVKGSTDMVGGLVGSDRGTISDCYTAGIVIGPDQQIYNHVGGLVGAGFNIVNSYSSAEVIGPNIVGGLAGSISGNVLNSHFEGNLFTPNGTNVGGLVGSNDGIISNSYSSSEINGDNHLGGLVGINSGVIFNSSSNATVNTGRGYSGGLVGTNYAVITRSYSTGIVSGAGVYIGGLVGENTLAGTISDSYANGDVNGYYAVGGLVGSVRDSAAISNSYATGDVNGNTNVGGLVGETSWASVFNSYSTGTVNGISSVGGLVGEITMDSTISTSYSTGKVYGTSKIGGLVGYSYLSNCTNSFWDTQTSNKLTSACGTGKTTSEMKTDTTFINAGWDFNNIWRIAASINDGYPYSVFSSLKPIATCSELQNMQYDLAGHYYLIKDIDCSETKTWNRGEGFKPIGGAQGHWSKFGGTFDGRNYVIKNLYINQSFPGQNIGLFGHTLGAKIENVGLINATIFGSFYTGILLGAGGVFTVINHSYSTGNVVGLQNGVGGLVAVSSGEIYNSYSEANVVGGFMLSGGLVGLNTGRGIISDCYSTGNVTGGNYEVGGLVGRNNNLILNSYSTGYVSGNFSIGGLVGVLASGYGICKNSFWDTLTSNQRISACGTGKTTTQMKTQSTFADSGWNFDNIWEIMQPDGTDYPKLRKPVIIPICTPLLVNTTPTSWTNISCLSNNKINQSRNLTQYDANNCGGANTTFVDYRATEYCQYCTPNWVALNTSCDISDKLTLWHNDTNRCYAQTGLASDNNPPANQTFSCNYCTEDIHGPINTSCTQSNIITTYWIDLKYASCCQATSLPSDCHINNGSYNNLTISCNYNYADSDKDGIPDINDTLEGNESNVITSRVSNLNISVGGKGTNGTFQGKQEMVFYDGIKQLVNLTHNFSASEIDFQRVYIEVTSNSLVVNLGGQLLPNERKTLYLDDNNFASLCVKDADISSISEISSGCNGVNETDFTSCLGNSAGITINNITCYDLGTRIKVENLKYSGIKGTVQTITTPGGGGGGGGGGKAEIITPPTVIPTKGCVERWVCDEWQPTICPKSGIQTRACDDANNCGTFLYKEPTTKACEYLAPAKILIEEKPKEITIPKVEKPKTYFWAYLIVSLIVIFLLTGEGVVLYEKRHKVVEEEKKPLKIPVAPPEIRLQNYIEECLAMGFSKERIRDGLIKGGWKQELVDYVFKKMIKK